METYNILTVIIGVLALFIMLWPGIKNMKKVNKSGYPPFNEFDDEK